MKPFDLEKAKAGQPVITREGLPVKFFSFQMKNEYPICGYVIENDGQECVTIWNENGKEYKNSESDYDLFMTPVKKEGWINVYKDVLTGVLKPVSNTVVGGGIHSSKEEAKNKIGKTPDIIQAKITWEE
jgi:hypothetical protein